MSDLFTLWSDFESGLTENGRIAADIDKLENLVQLYLYEQHEVIEGSSEWKQWIEERIHTARGNELLRIIKEKYEA